MPSLEKYKKNNLMLERWTNTRMMVMTIDMTSLGRRIDIGSRTFRVAFTKMSWNSVLDACNSRFLKDTKCRGARRLEMRHCDEQRHGAGRTSGSENHCAHHGPSESGIHFFTTLRFLQCDDLACIRTLLRH